MATDSDDDNGPRYERRLEEITDRLDALEINGNRDWVDNRRPGDNAAHGDAIEQPIVAHRRLVYNEDSEEEDEYEPHEFPKH
ncbi:hypothetical protein GH714_012872 [Hevea brasiliensis]|uniref:Uncharacterized protein n=1 Tax=Hevea brasiliensis TaxID=3981 RepID=A0A6A6M183_HEVBR|nr:hypothetical protein GH714_012872 [Hevea brasiliensis]